MKFVTFIYQDRENKNDTSLCVYDIEREEIVETTSLLPNKNNQEYLYKDELGFYVLLLTRSSDRDIIKDD